MSKTLNELLKDIDKLSHIEKEQVYQWVKRYVEPSSSVGGRLINEMIGAKLSNENVLVTDAWRAYKTYAKEKGIEHYRIKSNDGKHVIKGLYHIQNGNGLHSRLKRWIDRFKGVATKYLDNYLAWFLFVDSRSNESTKHNIKEFLLTSFVFEMTDTYDSLRISKFIV